MKKTITKSKGNGVFFLLCAAWFLPSVALFSGCGNKFFDPTQVGRWRPVPAVNVILDSLGVAEETPVAWEGAEEPLPIDTVVTEADYALRSADIVRVAIFELLQENVPFINDYVITETGKVSIPEVGVVQAAGFTETQLEEEIRRILSPGILKNPQVTVTLVISQQRAFSIIGDGVAAPSRYIIPRYDFRLTDALAMAGGPRQFNVSYIYVSRFIGNRNSTTEAVDPGFGELELKVIEPKSNKWQRQTGKMVAPERSYQWPKSKVVIASSEMTMGTEPTTFPRSLERFRTRTGNNWVDSGDVRSRLSRPPAQQTEEPIGVEDILKTLSERSHRQRMASERMNLQDTTRPLREPAPRQRSIYDSASLRDALRTSAGPETPEMPEGPPDTEKGENIQWIFQDGKWVPVQVEAPKPTEEGAPGGHIEWIYQDGKWVPVQVGAARPAGPVIDVQPEGKVVAPPEEQPPQDLEWVPGANTRLIRIPADKLLAGDPRYNIVIKAGDTILVPVDIVGEFCITGNVNRTGYIPLTGRPMTLKQAIAAAGGLGPLAWPKKCEVVRRIGKKKEEIVMVDLDKIASGEQPDFFIKPHDLINVGTHATSRWRAILRNAFRATYGFGFVYDRNFGDRDFYTRRPIPSWF